MPYTRRPSSEWSEHIRAYRESKESAERYAKRNGLSISTFRAWIAKLKTSPALPRFAPVVLKVPPAPKRAPGEPASASLVLEIGSVRLRVEPGFDRALLAEVIQSLTEQTS